MPQAMHVLLVEDESDGAASVSRVLEELGTEDRVVHVRHIEDALAYLATRPSDIPLLVLLDLEAPGGGVRLLEAIKRDESLVRIPVIVLARSDTPGDILASFQYGIAGYLIKPRPYHKVLETVKTVADYWRLSQLPTCA